MAAPKGNSNAAKDKTDLSTYLPPSGRLPTLNISFTQEEILEMLEVYRLATGQDPESAVAVLNGFRHVAKASVLMAVAETKRIALAPLEDVVKELKDREKEFKDL